MSKFRLLLHRFCATFVGRRAEADLEREITAHLQLLEDEFIAGGMTPEEARFAAKRSFGNVEHTKELQRDARGFRWLTGWTLELKLGLRMLIRYPGLTVVGGLALAFAIVVGASVFEVIKRATDPVLPLPDGKEIVGLTYWDRRENVRKPSSSYDFLKWRDELTKVKDVGAFRFVQRNFAPEGGVPEPVTVVQISPAAFQVARVPPLLGRILVQGDENPSAPSVVVLGYRLWQARFGGDRAVVGRTVRLGDTRATVAGVMPEGFAFPVDDDLWVPLRSRELVREPGHDALKVFGRLAPGATLQEAQAEAAQVAGRARASFPDLYSQLTPQVLPYANSILWLSPDLFIQFGIHSINGFAVLLLIVICANVALLILTRTATREKEIVVRTALGATPGRILTQLSLEALVLAAFAVAVGLTATNLFLKGLVDVLRVGPERWPFWLNPGLSPATLGYAAGLAVIAAVIVGVVPGLKVIGREMSARLRQSSAGAGGLRMGKLWTGLVITQIAATVLFAAFAYVVHRQAVYLASVQTVFPTAKYLSVRLEMESQGAGDGTASTSSAQGQDRQRFAGAVRELERRLAGDPEVMGVTVADQLPLMASMNLRGVEVSGVSTSGQQKTPKANSFDVETNFFKVFQMPVVAGRTFDARDLNQNANTVVVNSIFVDQVLGGRNAVGQRIRYKAVAAADDPRSEPKPRPWLEIVGVVRDLAPDAGAPLNLDNPAKPRLYRCRDTAQASNPLYLAVHARTDPQSLGLTLRRIAGEVSPLLQLHDILPLDHAANGDSRFWRVSANVFLGGSAIVLFLSLAGIYSVTSYMVARRTREIGVRVALGAPASQVLVSIFRGPLLQVAAGVVAGCGLLALVVLTRSGSGVAMARQAALLLAYGVAVMGVCALACIGPAVRALRVDPVEALREDA